MPPLAPTASAETSSMPALPPKKIPTCRQLQTFDAAVAKHRVHVSVSEWPPGAPYDIAIDMHKEGAPFRGVMNAVARTASAALQHGTPIEAIVEEWLGTSFEPCGETDDGDVPEVSSILDWIARTLAAAYLPPGWVQQHTPSRPAE